MVSQSISTTSTPVVSQDSVFNNLGNIISLTQTPPVNPTLNSEIPPKSPLKPTTEIPLEQPVTSSETTQVVDLIEEDEDARMVDTVQGCLKFNDIDIPPLSFDEEPPTGEVATMFASKSDIFSANQKLNVLLLHTDVLKQRN